MRAANADGFELFENVGRHCRPWVSIRQNGQLGFNSAAVTKYGIDRYTWAQLFFAAKGCGVGIKFWKQRPEHGGLKLVKQPTNHAVCARAFLHLYDIPYGERCTGYELLRVEDNDRMFFFMITEGTNGR